MDGRRGGICASVSNGVYDSPSLHRDLTTRYESTSNLQPTTTAIINPQLSTVKKCRKTPSSLHPITQRTTPRCTLAPHQAKEGPLTRDAECGIRGWSRSQAPPVVAQRGGSRFLSGCKESLPPVNPVFGACTCIGAWLLVRWVGRCDAGPLRVAVAAGISQGNGSTGL